MKHCYSMEMLLFIPQNSTWKDSFTKLRNQSITNSCWFKPQPFGIISNGEHDEKHCKLKKNWTKNCWGKKRIEKIYTIRWKWKRKWNVICLLLKWIFTLPNSIRSQAKIIAISGDFCAHQTIRHLLILKCKKMIEITSLYELWIDSAGFDGLDQLLKI